MAALAALLILLTVCLVVAKGPYHLYVNGQRFRITQVGVAADCAQLLGLSLAPGHLLDARGDLLVFEGGQSGKILRNGRLVPPDSPVAGGDVITVIPGGDTVEPIIEKVSFLPERAVDTDLRTVPLSAELSSFRGLRRLQRGEITGKIRNVEITQVLVVVNPPGSPERPRAVALTFDDGPIPRYTSQILDILAARGARATFFVLGYLAKRYPDLVRRAAREGHEIGIHSWDHDDFTQLSDAAISQDIQRCRNALTPLIEGHRSLRWFRPPYGHKNARVEGAVRAAGCRMAMWTLDTADWRRPGSNAIYNRVLNRIRNHAVVAMHDGGGPREGTVEAVRRLVPVLQQQGYKLVTLSELKGLVPLCTGEVVVASAEGMTRLKPVDELTVVIDGEEVELPSVPLEAEGQLLVPPQPILRHLGASYRWDKEQQIVHISGLNGKLLLRLDSREAEKNGQPIMLRVPPVLCRDTPMLPLWALVNITGAQARYDSRRNVLTLASALTGQMNLIPYSQWAQLQPLPVEWLPEY